jgi:ribosome recycling factor
MIITRRSILDRKIREMDINVTPEQLRQWRNGALIQVVMPQLTPDEREFIMTGIVPEEWEKLREKPDA